MMQIFQTSSGGTKINFLLGKLVDEVSDGEAMSLSIGR